MLKLIYPALKTWAKAYGYLMPSMAYLRKYDVEAVQAEAFTSQYKGQDILAVGVHIGYSLRIRLAVYRPIDEIFSTMVHEFAHAIQLYNLGARYGELYNLETVKLHDDNRFEVEAYYAQAMYDLMKSCNPAIGRKEVQYAVSFVC